MIGDSICPDEIGSGQAGRQQWRGRSFEGEGGMGASTPGRVLPLPRLDQDCGSDLGGRATRGQR